MSYLLVARDDGKLGTGLRASTVDCAKLLTERAERARAAGGGPMASMLSGQLNRPVLDRTSLKGNFDFQIE